MEEASSSPSSSSSSSCASPRAVPWMQIAVRGVPLSASDDDLKNHFGGMARFSIWLQHRRIKVYNLPPGTTSSQFRAYFEEFGTVTEAVVGPDGSGYVVFKWDESLRKVLKKKLHLFYGTELKARRESWGSEAFLVANAAQHESTGSATPCAHGVAYTPTRPAYTDSTCIATTPYDALYTPSYNRPTTAVPHAYSAPTLHSVDVETRTAGPSRNSSNNANVSNSKKIFVGGVPRDITYDEFRAYFEKFGPITKAFVPIDKNINRSRGFGFVTFETEESAHEVLKNQFHKMRPDKKVEVKKAIPMIEENIRCDNNNNDNGVSSSSNNIIDGHQVDVNVPNDKKIFVGGLPTDITDDELWAYFGKFGLITDAFVVKDKIDLVIDKNIYRPRGFGFVTFETKESANEVLKNQFYEMRPGKKVEVKKAIP
uniref:RRM domain-containing protein n=1 Tax=Ananas comosus var. bracteatus TaxID=296719 RepID=A0A6V7PBI4_ANACO|nr:unnamed protein product [Ananas comosus var. bracteatus]